MSKPSEPATSPGLGILSSGPPEATDVLLLAHGAGAPMTSPFLERVSDLLAARGIATRRFEFSYMACRRTGGTRRPPPRAETLMGEMEAAVEAVRATLGRKQRLIIGGKSMGGRVASLLADRLHGEKRVAGLAVLGYPFHPPDKPDQLRTAHLLGLKCPALVVQGECDPFGTRAEVESYGLPGSIRMHWIAGGDHDLAPHRGSGHSHAEALAAAADSVATFCGSL